MTARPRSFQEWEASARALCDDWLRDALSTRPADRATAQAAVTDLYRLLGSSPPRFVWVPSPAAAVRTVLDSPGRFSPAGLRAADALPGGPGWPVAARLASLAAELRDRMDTRLRRPPRQRGLESVADPGGTRPTPQAALAAGASWDTVLRGLLDGPLTASLRDAVRAPLRTALLPTDTDALGLTWHGQHDAYWIAAYDARARLGVARYHEEDVRQLGLWTDLARSTGWWWAGDGVCVMAERPAELHTERLSAFGAELRLHRMDGPAVRFTDGTRLHVLHGTPVPEWVVTGPTVERIHAERNVEVRRSAIERLGWAAYIEQASLRLVATADDPGNPGSRLQLYDVPLALWRRPARLLLTVNGSVEPDGTRRRYGLGVPGHLDDPVAAAGWTYGLSGGQYARLVRRT
ncbi:DUF6745 domain-containing protein [Streptomyces resistomycificus]|uniref:DUF6745 domain-containing protein n=1 Tax=Streptomyces resistomycificus TaxID=67356 RepID=UPI000AA2C5CC|nr:hypothetical protein [Streptomyces resistomycificus]